ncbi:MAG: EAL domain-containing protein [Clostridia bacterium]|nr:EAL domain-containing protein [Clostridia bacterium]
MDNNYAVHYQPQFDVDGKCNSAEALFRLKYNDMPIYPDVIFSLAHYFGHERELVLFVLDKVCKDIYTINQAKNSQDFYISYNINQNLIDEEFVNEIINITKQNKITPKNLGIELLEAFAFDQVNINNIHELKSYGYRILIDDFGAGYTNEGVLISELPFDTVKFSEKLISGIHNPEKIKNYYRVKNVMKFCKENKICTVAEHIETAEELKVVKDLGVDKIQGWYFSKALPQEQLLEKCGASKHCL